MACVEAGRKLCKNISESIILLTVVVEEIVDLISLFENGEVEKWLLQNIFLLKL